MYIIDIPWDQICDQCYTAPFEKLDQKTEYHARATSASASYTFQESFGFITRKIFDKQINWYVLFMKTNMW